MTRRTCILSILRLREYFSESESLLGGRCTLTYTSFHDSSHYFNSVSGYRTRVIATAFSIEKYRNNPNTIVILIIISDVSAVSVLLFRHIPAGFFTDHSLKVDVFNKDVVRLALLRISNNISVAYSLERPGDHPFELRIIANDLFLSIALN